MKKLLMATVAAVLFSFGARAETVVVRQAPAQALPDEVVEVQGSHHATGGIIVGDAIGGAVLGTAVGGGVALYNRNQNGNWGNWQRDLLIGGGIGLGVGLIVGIVDVAAYSDTRQAPAPYADQRQVGFGSSTAQYGFHF